MSGILTGPGNGGTVICNCDNGEWVCYNNVNLGAGYNTFTACLAVPSSNAGQTVEVRLDGTAGTLVGTLHPANTGSWDVYQEQSISLTGASGNHSIYVRFVGATGIGNFDWFRFSGE